MFAVLYSTNYSLTSRDVRARFEKVGPMSGGSNSGPLLLRRRVQLREARPCDDGPQHPVALVPPPPERQRLGVVEQLPQIGVRLGVGRAEVEAAEPRVRLCTRNNTTAGGVE